MTPETIDKIKQIIGTVQDAVDEVTTVLESAGIGGHLNETQEKKLFDSFAGLAVLALTAWHDASGKPITVDSILALLPDATPLPLPTVGVETVAQEPQPEPQTLPSAEDLDTVAQEQKAVENTEVLPSEQPKD